MFSSLLLLTSSLQTRKMIQYVSILLWVMYMLLGSNFTLGWVLPLLNMIAFGAAVFLANVVKKRVVNQSLAILSILTWSITMDILCYFFFPSLTFGQSLVSYILNGLLFNCKFVLLNVGIVVVIRLLFSSKAVSLIKGLRGAEMIKSKYAILSGANHQASSVGNAIPPIQSVLSS